METMSRVESVESFSDDTSDIAILRSIVGDEVLFHKILEMFGGTSVYFPKLDRLARSERVRGMYRALMKIDGLSSSQAVNILAQREHVTARHIYRILKIDQSLCELNFERLS